MSKMSSGLVRNMQCRGSWLVCATTAVVAMLSNPPFYQRAQCAHKSRQSTRGRPGRLRGKRSQTDIPGRAGLDSRALESPNSSSVNKYVNTYIRVLRNLINSFKSYLQKAFRQIAQRRQVPK